MKSILATINRELKQLLNKYSNKLPKSGFIFITGITGSGKTHLMQSLIKANPQTDFAVYGMGNIFPTGANEYENVAENVQQRFSVSQLSDTNEIDWFGIRAMLFEDLQTGKDIVFDEATLYINEHSIDVLKPIFSGLVNTRIFFITSEEQQRLLHYNHPLSLFSGVQICPRPLKSDDYQLRKDFKKGLYQTASNSKTVDLANGYFIGSEPITANQFLSTEGIDAFLALIDKIQHNSHKFDQVSAQRLGDELGREAYSIQERYFGEAPVVNGVTSFTRILGRAATGYDLTKQRLGQSYGDEFFLSLKKTLQLTRDFQQTIQVSIPKSSVKI